MIKWEQGSGLGGTYRFFCLATADTIGSCPIYRSIRSIMGSWTYIWRNWDRSYHNNRSMREQRGKFLTNCTSPDHIMSCNLPLAKKTFLLDEQWARGGGQAYEMAAEYVQRGRNMLSIKTTFSFIQEPLDEKTCTWIRNNFSHKRGIHVIKPGHFVRFLSFLFSYTPKRLPSSNTFAEERVICPWLRPFVDSSVFETWSLVPNFS